MLTHGGGRFARIVGSWRPPSRWRGREHLCRPRAHALEAGKRRVAVERLLLRHVAVPELDSPRRQRSQLVGIRRPCSGRLLDQLDQPLEIVREWILDTLAREYGLQHFSVACCAWKPTIPSDTPGSSRTASISDRSSSARATRVSATSPSSPGDKASLLESAPHDVSPHASIALSLLLRVHEHIDRRSYPAQLAAQAHHLRVSARNLGLDHQEVEIAVRRSISARIGAEEEHLRARPGRRRKALSRVLDHLGTDHEGERYRPAPTGSWPPAA